MFGQVHNKNNKTDIMHVSMLSIPGLKIILLYLSIFLLINLLFHFVCMYIFTFVFSIAW